MIPCTGVIIMDFEFDHSKVGKGEIGSYGHGTFQDCPSIL